MDATAGSPSAPFLHTEAPLAQADRKLAKLCRSHGSASGAEWNPFERDAPDFESYARLLHPAEEPRHAERLVRWAEVAAWSGVDLVPGVQFHEIAIPEEEPAGASPWRSQGPREGALCAGDAATAVEVLASYTSTPGHCWFCLWDGYGWDGAVLASPGTASAKRLLLGPPAGP